MPGANRCGQTRQLRRRRGLVSNTALLVLTAIGCCWLASPASGKSLLDREWIEVRTENFVIWSDARRSRVEPVAEQLENFRSAVAVVTNIERLEQRVPTYIYLANRNYREFGFERNIAGAFRPGLRANYTLAFLNSGWEIDNLVKHEYVHFILRNHGQHVYPQWYDEGFADLLSTLQVENQTLEYGRGVPNYLYLLRAQGPSTGTRVSRLGGWVPFEKVLSARQSFTEQDGSEYYYAQSWLLVHHILLGRPGVDQTAQLGRFLALTEAGTDELAAFEQAFGLEVDALGSAMRRYRDDLKFIRLTMNKPFPPVQTAVRTMTREETAVRMANLALHWDRPEDALRWFDAALSENPRQCDALAGKGAALTQLDRLDEAGAYLEKAAEIHPENALHELDLASYYLALAGAQDDDPALRGETLVEARRHFARSYKADSRNPETLLLNGLSYRFPGEDLDKAIASLEEAVWLLPSHSRPRFELAKAYLEAGRTAEASAHLARLLAWAKPDELGPLRELQQRIDAAAQAGSDSAPDTEVR